MPFSGLPWLLVVFNRVLSVVELAKLVVLEYEVDIFSVLFVDVKLTEFVVTKMVLDIGLVVGKGLEVLEPIEV